MAAKWLTAKYYAGVAVPDSARISRIWDRDDSGPTFCMSGRDISHQCYARADKNGIALVRACDVCV